MEESCNYVVVPVGDGVWYRGFPSSGETADPDGWEYDDTAPINLDARPVCHLFLELRGIPICDPRRKKKKEKKPERRRFWIDEANAESRWVNYQLNATQARSYWLGPVSCRTNTLMTDARYPRKPVSHLYLKLIGVPDDPRSSR